MTCACFVPKHSPFYYFQCQASAIAVVGKNFDVYSYDLVHDLPNEEMLATFTGLQKQNFSFSSNMHS